jgi:hypothetical protein
MAGLEAGRFAAEDASAAARLEFVAVNVKASSMVPTTAQLPSTRGFCPCSSRRRLLSWIVPSTR